MQPAMDTLTSDTFLMFNKWLMDNCFLCLYMTRHENSHYKSGLACYNCIEENYVYFHACTQVDIKEIVEGSCPMC